MEARREAENQNKLIKRMKSERKVSFADEYSSGSEQDRSASHTRSRKRSSNILKHDDNPNLYTRQQ